ncbi:disintegrin and metalloproteinase domain-containing protein 33 [Oncorhynchus nerka]|uniref:disintegrin and metalloproteinase domain-containing protein 33 n=1 Tax=Oncorhynchus nerka TaxID=8023 RepID=UPI0031B8A6CA
MYSKHRQKNAQISPAQCGRSLIMLSLLLLNGILESANGDTRVQGELRGQTVTAQWISPGRTKREDGGTAAKQDQYPDRGEIVLSSNNLELVLQVERNQELLGPDFTETHYSEDGQPVTVATNYSDHCFYHGHVRGHMDSWAALSTCSGVRGLIALNSNDTYYLEPIRGLDSRHHSLVSADDLPIRGGTCGHGHQTGHPNLLSGLLKPLHQRVRRNAWGTTKYMELYIVADSTLYKRQNKDYQKTKLRIMEIANYVDKFYRALNIRVPLIGLEVWKERDECIITEEPNTTLWSFLQWRQKLKSRKKHDNAQLLTGVIFKGTTIGMAPLEGMCSLENSGGINVVSWMAPLEGMCSLENSGGINVVSWMAPLEGMCSLENSGGINVVSWMAPLEGMCSLENSGGINVVSWMAPLEGMCSLENSGGINVDHSDLPIGAAATMAHEIGHNFGMSHDHEGCCVEATAEQGGCVMAAATGHPFPRVFSRCSKLDLDNYFQKGGGMCLFNMPDMKDLVGGKRCGNGFVEDGEECDCGEPEECSNDCCNANNCSLKAEAQCAHGVCCEGCKLKQAGTMCRGPAGACDLPEYCTGGSPYCPSNVYLLDGSSCQYGHAYCYNGMCLTHEQQCLQLWGYGARPAHDACFQDVNAAGNAFGNCGKDGQGNYMKCEKSDAKCGKIQCHSAAKKPKGTNAVSIDTTIRTDGMEVKCRGTYVYTTQDGQGDLPDPGLVMTGTKCGEGKVCRDRRCQNASFTELEGCIARCHGHGVCNSNGNCHCNRGWAPPFCEKLGLGGSVDSGPVQYHSQLGLVLGLLFVFLVLLPGILITFYCYKIKSSYYHKWLSQRDKNNKANRLEGSMEKGKNGHLNPAFHLKVVGPANKGNSHKGLPHTSKEVLPLRPGPTPNGTQPVNIVRPLRPAPSPHNTPRRFKVAHPPLLVSKQPGALPKSPAPPQKLTPPKKPLPLNPTRSPLVSNPTRSPLVSNPTRSPLVSNPTRSPLLVSELQPRHSPSPPQRPLPLSPARGVVLPVSPARAIPPKPSNGLLVMMPPAVGPKPVGKLSVIPPLKALRLVPGAKPNTVSSPFRK